MGLRMDNLHAPTVASGPTSQPTVNGTGRKQTLGELIAAKEQVEGELSALGSVLESHGVNMNTSLTTFDGYPRADIDVAQIRTTRARIVRLKNDHKALMAKVEEAVHEHFAAGKTMDAQQQEQAQEQTQAGSATRSEDRQEAAPAVQSIEPPFAKVNTIVPDSPAAQAGLRVGDKVTRLGGVNWTNHERLSRVAQVVQQNENRTVVVKVLREGSGTSAAQTVELELTPRRNWGGRGLLGCHLLPL